MLDRDRPLPGQGREQVWTLIEDTPAGFTWLAIAGKTLARWVVIDMDTTLVTARSDKEGAARPGRKATSAHWAPGARIPASAWPCCRRPGDAGSNTFTDHRDVLAAVIRQVPVRFRSKILVRVDGAGRATSW